MHVPGSALPLCKKACRAQELVKAIISLSVRVYDYLRPCVPALQLFIALKSSLSSFSKPPTDPSRKTNAPRNPACTPLSPRSLRCPSPCSFQAAWNTSNRSRARPALAPSSPEPASPNGSVPPMPTSCCEISPSRVLPPLTPRFCSRASLAYRPFEACLQS